MSYVYMKVLESAPERYERGMRILTLGRLEWVRRDIAARLHAGDRVLDLGCGTGALAALLAWKGCKVTGVDISPPMLSQAARRIQEEDLEAWVTLQEIGVAELDTAFGDASFDAVVSTLLFSELSDDEVAYALGECHRILKPGGQFLLSDEVLPDSWAGRLATLFLRLPFALLAFVLTQNTTHRVAGLRERIERAGFRMLDVERYLAGTLQLFVAKKAD
jgi:ubiquinone/menaquinone biosynthesis C-methylase UbiE